MKPARKNLFLAIAGSAALTVTYAQAQSGSWLGDAAGDWGNATLWTGGIIADGAQNTATFGNVITANRIINLDSARTIGNITASDTSHDYTISGANILTLDRTDTTQPTINVGTSGRVLTISSQISGTDGLLKSGAGTLTLSGNNNFSGGITLSAGVLRISTGQSFTGGVVINGGAFGDNTTNLTSAGLNGNAITVNGNASIGISAGTTFASGSTVNITAGLLTLATNNNTHTWNGAFTGAGGIVVGTLGLGGNQINLNSTGNTFTGGVDFTNSPNQTASLTVNSFADSATSGAGNIRFGISNTNTQTHTFALGSGAIVPLTLANRQFNIAGTNVNAVISNNSGQAFTISSNTANSGTGNRTLTLGGTGAGLSTFSGNITNGTLTTLSVTKSATANQWNLSGNNSFNGGLSTGNGGSTSTLGLGSATAWGTGTFTIGTGRFDNTSGASLTMTGNNAIAWNGDTTFLGTNNLDLGTGAVTMGGNRAITVGGTLTMGGIVSDGASDFNITKGGGGTLVLSGLNSYSGRTTVNQGVLSINSIGNVGGGNSALGNPATVALGTVNLGATTTGGTLRYTGTGTVSTDRVINLNGTTGGAGLDMSGTGTLTFTSNLTATGGGIKTLTLTGSTAGIGVIEGAIVNNSGTNTTALSKTGSGTWTLSGPNTYSGGTTIGTNAQNVGTLNITHSSALGTGAVSMISNSGSGNLATLTLNSATGITVANNFSTSGEGQGVNGIIRNVTGDNEISGTITLMGGGGSTRIHSDGGSLTLSGAIAPNTTGRFLFLGGGATGEITGNINNGAGANTLSGLTKEGVGTWTLSGTNGYSGPTAVSAGTLKVSGGAAIPNAGLVSIANAAGVTFQVVGSETIGALSGGGATGGDVSIDSSQTLSLSSGTQTYSGTVSGSGALTNSGAIQTLNGALSHTGGVNVSGGVLTLGSSSNTYTGATAGTAGGASILVTADGALGATGAGNGTTVFGAGTGNGSQLGFSGGINYTGAEKVVGSGAGSTTNSLGAFASGNRGFIQSVSGNNTFAGDIELNANGLSRIGTQDGAQLTLTGAITQGTGITTASILFRSGNTNGDFVTITNTGNSFGGNSTVFSSLATPGQYSGLRLGADNAHPTNLTVQNFSSSSGSSTSFDLNGNDQTLNGLASGGTGTLNIINLDTVNASTLTLNPTEDRTNAANMTILGGSPGGTPLGVINVVKDGSFKQTLVGNHTYTGTTLVSAGTLFVTGSLSSNVTVSANATVGGGGTVGDISFAGGSFLDIALAVDAVPDSLTTGAISFATTGFGVDNLVFNGAAVDWNTVGNGTYTLLTGTLDSMNLENFGLLNAYDLGGGRSAYFQSGSLQLVVVPEPNVAALIGALGAILLLRRRR